MIEEADAVFFGGGYPMQLHKCMFGDQMNGTSPLYEAIMKKELIMGTSAGALVQPVKDVILTAGYPYSYDCVVQRKFDVHDSGFKMFKRGLVDVHFRYGKNVKELKY